ncbi:hypothetical protein [Paenibacillus sp. MDMC362]|uniref:hypothetical protein n=1 Tax=Paenibacillus sp. MDMC362 TaxID=2977365 RepID=UPI000DC4E62A|nr:hypothetical protein [Paenibacillus sp. MDMC362]RAR39646.1 hypothetical protein DP091_29615 [Paenibacillus sp. MDMC362]
MRIEKLKTGRTYVYRNGLLRRLEKLEDKDGTFSAGFIPIDRKGNEGQLRWSKAETFAHRALGEAKA